MYTDVQIINMGMSKIGASPIRAIDPPRTSLEKYIAANYVHWRRSELAKRRWVFATETNYSLPKIEELSGVDLPYKFGLPVECLRLIRKAGDTWRQSRRYVYADTDPLVVSFIVNVPENEMDELFVEVLAWRIGYECAEYVTQSNTKKADAVKLYDNAVAEAGRSNAYVIGPENIQDNDNAFPFVTSRF